MRPDSFVNKAVRTVCYLLQELLTQVEEAEAAADQLRAEAQRQAREIVKAAEEAALLSSRAASAASRQLTGDVLEGARAEAQKRIESSAQAEAGLQAELRDMAAGRLDRVAAMIYARIVTE
jgi:vacuolar-type H+-ATPase subunit H